MKRSGVRAALAIVLILIIAGVAGLELKDVLATDDSVETEIGKLESYWPSRRRAAATELARFIGDAEKVVPTLVKALGDSDTIVRVNVLESLKSYGEKSKAAGPVARGLATHDPDQRIRQAAAALLGLIKDQDAVPVLLAALDDRDPAVRVEAIRSLGRFGRGIASGPLVGKLISAVGPEQPAEVREAGLGALGLIAPDHEGAARAIVGVAAKDSSPEIRFTAVDSVKKPIFEFQVPALIAALDDPSPRVRLVAGTNLARIGMSDDRTAAALCHAALTAVDATREGIGMNLDLLVLSIPTDRIPDEVFTRRLQNAVREFQTVLESREAGAREHVLNVLGNLIALYQSSGRPALLEPARAAVGAVLARLNDEAEEVPLRIHALNQWTVIQLGRFASARRAAARSALPAHEDKLHATSLWITALCGALKSAAPEVRSRAGAILLDHINDADSDDSTREAWRKALPSLAEVTKSEDAKVRHAALAILTLLGPEAHDALPALRSLADQSQDAAVKSAVEGAIRSISSIDDLKANDPAVKIAAAEVVGRLGWRATPALPALIAGLRDPETKVRVAVVNALQKLAPISATALHRLAAALADEPDAGVRVALLQALEAIAPGTPAVLTAHLNALRDPDAAVRAAGASFQKVPADDSLVSALARALGDASEDVRDRVASSLTEVLFESSVAGPALFNAMHDKVKRDAALKALGNQFEKTPTSADLKRVRLATLSTLIHAIEEALAVKDEQIRLTAYRVLGRIVSFSRVTRDEKLRKAVEPALSLYLLGLDQSDPAIREEVLGQVGSIPIRHPEIGLSLNKFLEQPDRTEQEREQAQLALKELATPAATDGGPARFGRQMFGRSL